MTLLSCAAKSEGNPSYLSEQILGSELNEGGNCGQTATFQLDLTATKTRNTRWRSHSVTEYNQAADSVAMRAILSKRRVARRPIATCWELSAAFPCDRMQLLISKVA